MKLRKYETGAVHGALIGMILLGLAVVMLVGLSIWLFMQYSEQKTNVDAKIDAAVAEAQKLQADEDEKKFAEREKEPNRQFVGPDDYGRLTFNYPKTWSLYVQSSTKAGSGGAAPFKAYLNPGFVPAITATERYALRVEITDTPYDQSISRFDGLVKKGDLKTSTVSANGQSGTRIDGAFTKDIRGAVVIFKIRDKTASIYTDADTFKPDFENIIKTIKYND